MHASFVDLRVCRCCCSRHSLPAAPGPGRQQQQAWVNGIDVSVKKRCASADSAAPTKRETLRSITKRFYNTARTNLFTNDIIRVFRNEAGACPKRYAVLPVSRARRSLCSTPPMREDCAFLTLDGATNVQGWTPGLAGSKTKRDKPR